jgi:D-alanyl-D-alanine carboxypeptidase (penicillin-binding protein 5/6)
LQKVFRNIHILILALYLLIGRGFCLPQAQAVENLGPNIEGQAAVLLEKNSGKFLYTKEEEQRLYPASTTKILTALVVLENCQPDEIVTIGEEINLLGYKGSSAGLTEGEQLTVEDLLKGLMLPSGNDAANVLATYVSRKLAQDKAMEAEAGLKYFADLMNKRALEAGAQNSHFVNAHGLHDESHYTTALDLAKIASQAMDNPTFRAIVKTGKYEVELKNKSELGNGEAKVWTNTNKLLDPDSTYYLAKATGIKTGFTTPAGYCLVSSASGNGLELIGVVLNTSSTGRWTDTTKLLTFGLEEFEKVQILQAGKEVTQVAIANASRKDTGELLVLATTDFSELLHLSHIPLLEKHIIWNEDVLAQDTANSLLAPIKEGQELGKVLFSLEGVVLTESIIVAARDVKSNDLLRNIFGIDIPYLWLTGLLIFIMLLKISMREKGVRRKRSIRL